MRHSEKIKSHILRFTVKFSIYIKWVLVRLIQSQSSAELSQFLEFQVQLNLTVTKIQAFMSVFNLLECSDTDNTGL